MNCSSCNQDDEHACEKGEYSESIKEIYVWELMTIFVTISPFFILYLFPGMTMTYDNDIKHGHINTDSGYTYGGYSGSQTVHQR